MAKTVAVCFEDDSIRVIHASLSGETLSVLDKKLLSYEEFDSYLRAEKAKEFVAVCDFRETFHDVITVPVVKMKYLEKVIESEIRKTTPVKNFSFIYTPVGERIIDNKKVTDVVYYAVNNEEVQEIANRFYNNGKMLKALYPVVHAVASLFGSADAGTIGVLGHKNEKTAFLTMKGALYFIRKFRSLSEDLTDIDIQDINMTINYCRQNVRISPDSVLLAGNISGSSNISMLPTASLACLGKPGHINCDVETFNDYIVPVASFYCPKASNILSREFRNLYGLKHYLTNAARVFAALTVLCLVLAGYEAKDASDRKARLETARRNNMDTADILSGYAAEETEINRLMPITTFLNRAAPSMNKLLITLSEMEMQDAEFAMIDAEAKDGAFLVTMNGTIKTDTFAAAQKSFQGMTDFLQKQEYLTITEKTLDMNRNFFSVTVENKDTGS